MKKTIKLSSPFKYIKNIAEDMSEATILLYGPIGTFQDEETGELVQGIDGGLFAQEMLFLTSQVKTIHVRINSIGGSVLDGFSIISAIKDSGACICTYNDGLAASISALILGSGDKRYARDYSVTMIHNPSGGDNGDLLDKIKESLLTILQNSSILSSEDLDKLMNEETYLDAEEAKELGLIDEILSSGKKVEVENLRVSEMAEVFNKLIDSEMKVKKDTKKAEGTEVLVTNSPTTIIQTTADVVTNKIGIESPETLTNADKEAPDEASSDPNEEKENEAGEDVVKQPGFLDKVKAFYGLNEDASEEDCYDAIKSGKGEHESLKEENARMQDKLETLAKEAKAAHRTKIDAMVNEFISAGKIQASDKESVTKLALADFDTVKNVFSKMIVPSAKPATKISNRISNTIDTTAPVTTTKKLEDYWKNDPKGLETIKKDTPDIYNQLVEDYREREKNKNK